MTVRQVGAVLWPTLRALQVYGANTGVGKTIFSSLLCRAFKRCTPNTFYLKPISTGALDEADDRHLARLGDGVRARCLYQFAEPVSPHIAARDSSSPPSDSQVQAALYDELASYAVGGGDSIAVIETAGGVLSPSPSGSSQADLYRPLRLPVLLVGDHQLGGIGTTISAWESLHIRGYHVESIALFAEGRYDNHTYLREYFAERAVNVLSVEPPPAQAIDRHEDEQSMTEYYNQISHDQGLTRFVDHFISAHTARIEKLKALPAAAHKSIWHPFLQHTERTKDNITAMDSAYGDYFATYTSARDLAPSNESVLQPAFDGSASWWTQGLGHGNPKLALTAAHAAGRYGHVMFASAIHEPALELAERLTTRMGNPRLSKVFYSDNGSTGMEVAVKMALRAASVRNQWKPDADEITILGLKGSYHGDTMGTMDCSEPSIYNKKVEWYQGRGHWLDFPQVKMRDGQWLVDVPDEFGGALGQARELESLEHAFDFERRQDDFQLYTKYCQNLIRSLRKQGHKLGALIMEPILLGAGGMFFVDPVFQRALVHAARREDNEPNTARSPHQWRGMPVVFDEVFTGLHRLGRFSAASFLDIDPDIVVNAKLLTGGLLPLCTTTASDAIYEAFLSPDKSDALLHGHSYTAHAVGCMVANESLDTMARIEQSASWSAFKSDWRAPRTSSDCDDHGHGHDGAWSMWSQAFVAKVSHRANVDYTFALGSVLAISLKDPAGAGYASTAAVGLRDQLLRGSPGDEWVIHSRVLGNVLYLMAAMTTTPESLRSLEEKLLQAI